MCVDYSCIEYMRDIIKIYRSAWYMAIIIYSFSGLYKKTHIQSLYNEAWRKLNHILFTVENSVYVMWRDEDYILRRNKLIITI